MALMVGGYDILVNLLLSVELSTVELGAARATIHRPERLERSFIPEVEG